MSLQSKEVLIIDDDPSHINLVENILYQKGMFTSFAHTIDEGINIIKRQTPHLILLDIFLEQETIFRLLETCSAILNEMGTKIIIFSASKDKNLITKAMTFGAHDYVVKPFSSTVLMQKVRKNLLGFSYNSIKFTEDEKKFRCSVKSELARFNEFELILRTPVKLMENGDFNLCSVRKEYEHLNFCKLVPQGKAYYGKDGLYENELMITGADEKTQKSLRRMQRVKA